MNKAVDIKVEVWQKLHFADDTDLDQIIKHIKTEGALAIHNEELGFINYETLVNSEKVLSVNQNNGMNTIEVYDGHNKVWGNASNNDWICTDPDCNQYRRKISEFVYEFVEDRTVNPATDEIEQVYAEIDLREESEDNIKKALQTFGYKYHAGLITAPTGVIFHSPELIAECIFELKPTYLWMK